MDTITNELFELALNLGSSWKVTNVEFKPNQDGNRELHIDLEVKDNQTFKCEVDECNEDCKIYDTSERTWRHLNFFQYKTFIHAKLPRIKCSKHGVKTLSVPWARKESGFTLLFEAFCLHMALYMPVLDVAEIVNEHDTRLWRIIRYWVKNLLKERDMSKVKFLGIDETSVKGHHYLSVFMDLEEKTVLHLEEGKDASIVTKFQTIFNEYGGSDDNILAITTDMSLGLKKGLNDTFNKATQIIDKFHVIKYFGEAINKTRIQEVKTQPLLKGSKYLFLRNEDNLNEKDKLKKQQLENTLNLKTAKVYAMRLTMQDIYNDCHTKEEAQIRIKKLIKRMLLSRIPAAIICAKTLKNHLDTILNFFTYKLTNSLLEGTNNQIQVCKTRARGFKNIEYFKTIVYLLLGKLNLGKPFKEYSLFPH